MEKAIPESSGWRLSSKLWVAMWRTWKSRSRPLVSSSRVASKSSSGSFVPFIIPRIGFEKNLINYGSDPRLDDLGTSEEIAQTSSPRVRQNRHDVYQDERHEEEERDSSTDQRNHGDQR